MNEISSTSGETRNTYKIEHGKAEEKTCIQNLKLSKFEFSLYISVEFQSKITTWELKITPVSATYHPVSRASKI